MKLLYVFEEHAPIFIEFAWGISLSSASRLLAATILAGALAGSTMAQAPDAGCALPSEPEGIPAALDAAITGPADKDRDCMKALLIPEARMIFVSLGTDGAPTYRIETLDAGPVIVTGLDYSNLRLRTWVNGDLRQDSSTRELVYSPNKLLSYVSQYITLLPGDVIFTGTPGKTQAVTHGDTIEIEIEGVGRLCNSVAG